jgi:type I restriction enzyme S subunit
MSYLENLVKNSEVMWQPLGDKVEIANIGVDKKINPNEVKVRLLNFVDVFKNQYISNETPTMFVTASERKIIDCNIKEGDVFITPSSELINEIGFSAMAIEDIDNAVYSYHIMRLRINDKKVLSPPFLNYLFNSTEIRKKIRLKAQGITRFGLTQPNWKSLQIPIPSLKIQKEIVRILDTFTSLTAKLTAELTARKNQYNYYREQLFNFDETDVLYSLMGDERIGKFQRGKRFVKDDIVPQGIPCIHYGEMYTYYGIWAKKSKSFLTKDLVKNRNLRMADKGDVVIVAAGETIEDLGKGTAWLGDESVVIHDACFLYKTCLNPKYIAYFTRTKQFHDQIKKHISSGKISAIHANGLGKVTIPVPSPAEQERIVTILDKFDVLTTSITEGLPKEITLRKKQYEYYRDMLLTFPKDN